MVSAVRSMARLLQEFRRQTPWSIAIGGVYEAVNELEEKEKQLPSWNRRGGPKGRGGSEVEMVVFESTTPSLRDTPPVPGACPSNAMGPHLESEIVKKGHGKDIP